jgi:hypothetical protein
MADRLYLSLWYPNFRLEALPGALTGVMRQFAIIGGRRVIAASAYPINFTESPAYQRLYTEASSSDPRLPAEMDPDAATADAAIEAAVAEATEQLHDDMAYEFEMKWKLWMPESGATSDPDTALDTLWKLQPSTVRILGFGPRFDEAGYEQNGHIRIDFGLDTPWVMDDTMEDNELDELAQKHIQQNVEMLLAFTLSVEKHCGISSRLLWTESGEPLAEKLIARLQRLN